MNVKLLTEHHLEFLFLKGGCTGSSESTLMTCQTATLLEITCRGSHYLENRLKASAILFGGSGSSSTPVSSCRDSAPNELNNKARNKLRT